MIRPGPRGAGPEPSGREPGGTGGEDGQRLGPTRIRDLLGIAVVAAVVLWILVRYNYGAFPAAHWAVSLTVYVLAAIEAGAGFAVRTRIAERKVGPADGQLHPISVARLVALAKASSILGAIAAGGWAGFGVFLLSKPQLSAAVADRPAAIVGLIGGVLLVAAALWLEHSCRAPDDPDAEEPAPGPAPGAA